MKTELETEDIDAIAEAVVMKISARLKDILPSTGLIEDDVMTVDEVAHFFKVKTSRIYSWVNDTKHGLNDFPFYKAGSSLRFSRKEIVEWAMRRAEKTKSEGDV